MIEVKLRFNEPPAAPDLSQLLAVARQVDHRNCATWSNDGKQWTLLIHVKSRVEGKEAIGELEKSGNALGLKYKTMRMMEAKTDDEE
ncbi:MAG: hypothetical protein E2O56_04475 [Gammaproteobacteria bacterium]|nr:MAG: hypothetical protein E2O56_04475 [Gammaproteobacteria bacterium]